MRVSEWTRIVLPSEPCDLLDWTDALEGARPKTGIVWDIRLGIERAFFPFDDPMRFEALALALKSFSTLVWPSFQEVTAAVCLYRGPLDVAAQFAWSERQRLSFAEETLSERQFCTDVLALYLQMLAHKLPDELDVLLLFDERSIASRAEALSLLSNERFAHFTLGLRGDALLRDGFVWDESGKLERRKIQTKTGLVFPERFDARFDRALEQLDAPAKVVFEAFLSEEWEGLDRLLVLEGTLGAQGMRKLKGFEAAGGEVVIL